jgi:hypothetical protein
MTKAPRHKDLRASPEAREALNEMAGSNDRTCAIVSLACLENNLVLAIMSRLRKLNETEQNKLFDSLLSSFSRQVEIALALDLFNHKIKSDLETLNKIRNRFAHHLEVSNFDHQEVASLCDALTYGKADEKALRRKTTRREKFDATIEHLSVRFAKIKDQPDRPSAAQVRTPPCYE